jgi:hypothetical protein
MKNRVIVPNTPELLAFREWSCARKKWYRTSGEANAKKWPGSRAYHCRFCDGYHVSTKPIESVKLPEGIGAPGQCLPAAR